MTMLARAEQLLCRNPANLPGLEGITKAIPDALRERLIRLPYFQDVPV